MENIRWALFLAILGLVSGFDSTFSFCEDTLEHDINLNLSDVGISRLKQSFVSSDNVKCLDLSSNGLSTIESGAFDGLRSLSSLDLSSNSINLGKFLELNELTNLKTLVVDSAFQVTERYREPYYYQHRTERTSLKLPMGYFPQLQKLSLSNYRTNDVREWLEKFETVTNLTHLRLNANRLTSFEHLPERLVQNLTHIWLDDNEIEVFSGLNIPKVRYLSMDKNKIQKLCSIYCDSSSMSTHSMAELEYLSLVGNKIESVDSNAFSDSANLITLNLAENSIQTFPRESFKNATSLESLRLDKNQLNLVPDLCGLTNLRELWIDGNRIKSIDETSFCHLPKLAVISLQKNQLTNVGARSFVNLPMLQELDMSGNNLVLLPADWSSPDSQIISLNLEKNGFTDISDMSLEQLENLQILSIERNPIKTFTIGALINLPPNTTISIDCGCGNNDPDYSGSRTTTYNPYG